VNKELRFRHFSVASYVRPVQPKRSQNQRLGFQIEINESLATRTVSIRQALNC
jgi:hypothetical protein